MRHAFLITAWLLWFLAHSTRMILSPVLPLIEDDLGLSHAQAGQLFVFLTAGYCTSLFSVPVWSRVLGYRRTVQAALAVLALTQILLYRAAGMKEMAALMFLVGLTTGTILPSAIPLLTAAYGKERWGRSIGVFDSAAPAGQFIAPVIAIAVLSVLSWRYVFWVMAAIAAMVIVMFVRTAPESEPRAERPRGSLAAVIRNRSLVTLAGLWALASAAGIGLGFLVPTYLVKERGMDLTAANQIFAAGRGMGILAAVYAGFLADRFTCRSLLVWILAVSGLSQMGIALWPENFGVGFWVFLEGGVHMMFFPVGLILIARVTGAGVRGTAAGLVIGVGVALGIGVTPWALGAVADAWSFRVGIAALGGITLLLSPTALRTERV